MDKKVHKRLVKQLAKKQKQGISIKDAAKELIKQGHIKEEVNQAVQESYLVNYIKKEKDYGYELGEIKQHVEASPEAKTGVLNKEIIELAFKHFKSYLKYFMISIFIMLILLLLALAGYLMDNPQEAPPSCIDIDEDGYCNTEDCNDYNNLIYPGGTEFCEDGIDNDCDGEVDENCIIEQAPTPEEETTTSCGDGECNGDEQIGKCRDCPCTDDQECKDLYGNDHECDGTYCIVPGNSGPAVTGADPTTDCSDGQCAEPYSCSEDPEYTTICSVGIGACETNGTYGCNSNGDGLECSATAGTPTNEICNDGIDNDCDGYTDYEDDNCAIICDRDGDNYYSLSLLVHERIYCNLAGYQEGDCNDNNTFVNPGESEICTDGLDNNCDTLFDCNDLICTNNPICNGCTPGEQLTCISGQPGVCAEGIKSCKASGEWGPCIVEQPIDEICDNGLDDNCDGETDENCNNPQYCNLINECQTGYCCENSICTSTDDLYCYEDVDQDLYGSSTSGNIKTVASDCLCHDEIQTGSVTKFVRNNLDCDDNNANVNPEGTEICNNEYDENCDGQLDESCTETCGDGTCDDNENVLTCPADCLTQMCTTTTLDKNAIEHGEITFSSTGGHDGSGAYIFDGVDDYLSIPNERLGEDGTICFWGIAFDNTGKTRFISSDDLGGSNAEMRTYANSATKLSWYFGNGNNVAIANSYGSISNTIWHHFCATWDYSENEDKTVIRAFYDGSITHQTALPGKTEDGDKGLQIGAWSDQSFLKGSIDEPILSSCALTLDEISEIYTGVDASRSQAPEFDEKRSFLNLFLDNLTPWN